jgi:hypothetical protein
VCACRFIVHRWWRWGGCWQWRQEEEGPSELAVRRLFGLTRPDNFPQVREEVQPFGRSCTPKKGEYPGEPSGEGLTPLLKGFRFELQHSGGQAHAVSRRLTNKLAQLQWQRFLVVEKVTSCTAALAGALLQGYSTSYPAPDRVPLRAPA